MHTQICIKYIRTFVAIVSLLLVQSALAVVPPTMNYQGHLTDSAGVPIDGPVSMTFAIYDVETGGIARWSESQTVTVDQGVFSVQLGGIVPFPNGLESPLWFALTVDTDAEMTPRRPFDTVAFAFNASNADALEGVGAASLDQSAHVIDMANPHGVSPAQIGAADSAALTAHTGDTANPHNVTAAQAGAVTSTDFTTHTGNSSAHHTRYSNSEAVGAMGVKTDGNPLHHDKYTDSNVVTAMLANDGAGSTLDSDKVDGLEASELIDAAQDEVRTPISSLPYTISQPGAYYLTGNLDGSAGGIEITTGYVTLDLMGFTMDGTGGINHYGIRIITGDNVIIKNGIIRNFYFAGIVHDSSSSRATSIIDVHALNNVGPGISLSGNVAHIERCVAAYNDGSGIYAGFNSILINNAAYNNSGYYAIGSGTGSVMTGNTAYNNNTTVSIYGGSGATISGNTAYSNSGVYGIQSGTGAALSGNTAYSNAGTGIWAGGASNLIGNTVYSNAGWGIYASSGSLIKDNSIYLNNGSNYNYQGGLHVYADSKVTGNTLDNNYQNNIYVFSSDNTIENNLVTDSNNGIFFYASGSFYGNNRAAGNATNFNLNGTSQTTNPEFPNISF